MIKTLIKIIIAIPIYLAIRGYGFRLGIFEYHSWYMEILLLISVVLWTIYFDKKQELQ